MTRDYEYFFKVFILSFVKNITGQELSSKSKAYEWTAESDEEEGIESTLELRGVSIFNYSTILIIQLSLTSLKLPNSHNYSKQGTTWITDHYQ